MHRWTQRIFRRHMDPSAPDERTTPHRTFPPHLTAPSVRTFCRTSWRTARLAPGDRLDHDSEEHGRRRLPRRRSCGAWQPEVLVAPQHLLGVGTGAPMSGRSRELLESSERHDRRPVKRVLDLVDLDTDERVRAHPCDLLAERGEAVRFVPSKTTPTGTTYGWPSRAHAIRATVARDRIRLHAVCDNSRTRINSSSWMTALP